MEAAEAKVQKILQGDKQFLVPHFQRPYSWREPEWRVLWDDLVELVGEDDPEPHFLGSIVSAPARAVPEGVEKRLLIDGQQRLTTVVLLLALIRERATAAGNSKLADRGIPDSNRRPSAWESDTRHRDGVAVIRRPGRRP